MNEPFCKNNFCPIEHDAKIIFNRTETFKENFNEPNLVEFSNYVLEVVKYIHVNSKSTSPEFLRATDVSYDIRVNNFINSFMDNNRSYIKKFFAEFVDGFYVDFSEKKIIICNMELIFGFNGYDYDNGNNYIVLKTTTCPPADANGVHQILLLWWNKPLIKTKDQGEDRFYCVKTISFPLDQLIIKNKIQHPYENLN